jgi:hypothetical protein
MYRSFWRIHFCKICIFGLLTKKLQFDREGNLQSDRNMWITLNARNWEMKLLLNIDGYLKYCSAPAARWLGQQVWQNCQLLLKACKIYPLPYKPCCYWSINITRRQKKWLSCWIKLYNFSGLRRSLLAHFICYSRVTEEPRIRSSETVRLCLRMRQKTSKKKLGSAYISDTVQWHYDDPALIIMNKLKD